MRRALLFALLVFGVLLAVWALAPRAPAAAEVGDPCALSGLPALGPGVRCSTGRHGTFAWMVADDANLGVVPSGSGAPIQSWTASEQSCVAENVCQRYCDADADCDFYVYDASRQSDKDWCPNSGAVCTTFRGAPTRLAAGGPPFVTAGVHVRALRPKVV